MQWDICNPSSLWDSSFCNEHVRVGCAMQGAVQGLPSPTAIEEILHLYTTHEEEEQGPVQAIVSFVVQDGLAHSEERGAGEENEV